jgi:hypothetical protein
MEENTPETSLLKNLCGSDLKLIRCIHHGLYESSLKEFYPVLDLQEILAFAGSSWVSRIKQDQKLNQLLEQKAGAYELFSHVYHIGIPWLRGKNNLSPSQTQEYQKFNPFHGKKLEERLDRVDEVHVQELRERLSRPVNRYVTESQYYACKRRNRGNNINLVLLPFPPSTHGYAEDIAKTLQDYSLSSQKKKEQQQKIKRELTHLAQSYFPGLDPREAYLALYPED